MSDFRIIEGGLTNLTYPEREFVSAVQKAAANVLRIIRGAGKPDELVFHCSEIVNAAVHYRERRRRSNGSVWRPRSHVRGREN
jgi:hypothetical protein